MMAANAGGLRIVSAGMAALCGLAAGVLAAMWLGLSLGTVSSILNAKPSNWSVAAPVLSGKGSFEYSEQTSCPNQREGACAAESGRSLDMRAPLAAGVLAAQTPLIALVYGLVQASLCFVGMAKGRFLDRVTVSRLKHFAIGGLLFVFAQPFAGAIGKAASTLTHRLVDLATGQQTFWFAGELNSSYSGITGPLMGLYAVTLAVLAAVMVRASRIADDHAQIV